MNGLGKASGAGAAFDGLAGAAGDAVEGGGIAGVCAAAPEKRRGSPTSAPATRTRSIMIKSDRASGARSAAGASHTDTAFLRRLPTQFRHLRRLKRKSKSSAKPLRWAGRFAPTRSPAKACCCESDGSRRNPTHRRRAPSAPKPTFRERMHTSLPRRVARPQARRNPPRSQSDADSQSSWTCYPQVQPHRTRGLASKSDKTMAFAATAKKNFALRYNCRVAVRPGDG